jgi:hypothetical protein
VRGIASIRVRCSGSPALSSARPREAEGAQMKPAAAQRRQCLRSQPNRATRINMRATNGLSNGSSARRRRSSPQAALKKQKRISAWPLAQKA